MPDLILNQFIHLDLSSALQVVLIGFIGGTLSGFIGSGGAFFMTPGMMNLGVPGVIAVGSNITHKFGKAMMGSKKHSEYGNVDKRLAVTMVITSFIGIRVAVWINSALFGEGGDGHGGGGNAASDLYISAIFIFILALVAISMLKDALKPDDEEGGGPSMKLANFVSRISIPPYIHFKVADVKVSLWVVSICGLATGYLAGTIGVGGFIGVPAMIYIFGVPTAVAAGSELYLAMFMGGWGALNYAFEGFVDIRLTLLLYLGSLIGVFIGAYGVKV
ncbi:MAG: sulfite exporter TauE/SafE family protein, partial [bacterium]